MQKIGWIFSVLFISFFVMGQNKAEEGALLSSMEVNLFSKIEVKKGAELVWSQDEKQTALVGRPVRFDIRSNGMLSVVHLTLYSQKNNQWMVLAQAEVWYSNKDSHYHSNYFQTAKTFLINEGQILLFYPFGKDSKENQNLDQEIIRLSLEIKE